MATSLLSRAATANLRFSHLNALVNGINISIPDIISPRAGAGISPQIHANFSTLGNRFRSSAFSFEKQQNRNEFTAHGFTGSNYQRAMRGFSSFSTKSLISSSSSSKADEKDDSESAALYPGISTTGNQLRWGFIRKVYGILSAQIGLSAAVASIPILHPPIAQLIISSPYIFVPLIFSPLPMLYPLFKYMYKHPINLYLLGIYSALTSLPIGVICAYTDGQIVFQALTFTSAVFASLTAYTFWASKKGKDFAFLGPYLLSSLMGLVCTGTLRLFFPLSSTGDAVYGAISALTFSGLIVFHTQDLIKRFESHQYVEASLALYLDVLNMFLIILEALIDRAHARFDSTHEHYHD